MYSKHYTQEQVSTLFGCGVPNICKISKRIGLQLHRDPNDIKVQYNVHHIQQLQDYFDGKRKKKMQKLLTYLILKSERLQRDYEVNIQDIRDKFMFDEDLMDSLLSDITFAVSNFYEDVNNKIYFRYGGFGLGNRMDLEEVWMGSGSIQIASKEFRSGSI